MTKLIDANEYTQSVKSENAACHQFIDGTSGISNRVKLVKPVATGTSEVAVSVRK